MKTILVDAVNGIVSTEGVFSQEMIELLEKYPNRKIIVTNADYEADNLYNLNNAPYEVFTLRHDPAKTNPEYYKKVLAEYNLSVADVICFEHNPEAVESAKSVGITTHFYDKDKQDLEALQNFLQQNL